MLSFISHLICFLYPLRHLLCCRVYLGTQPLNGPVIVVYLLRCALRLLVCILATLDWAVERDMSQGGLPPALSESLLIPDEVLNLLVWPNTRFDPVYLCPKEVQESGWPLQQQQQPRWSNLSWSQHIQALTSADRSDPTDTNPHLKRMQQNFSLTIRLKKNLWDLAFLLLDTSECQNETCFGLFSKFYTCEDNRKAFLSSNSFSFNSSHQEKRLKLSTTYSKI